MSDSEFRFEATVNPDGTFRPFRQADVRAWLLKWAGKRVYVAVEPERKRRSNPQNALLFGPIYDDLFAGLKKLAVDNGGICPFKTKEDLHGAMKYLFAAPKKEFQPGVGEMLAEPTTKTMNTVEFSEFIEKVVHWAAEKGIFCRTGFEEWSA